jgi:hypothetical protein
MSKSPLHADLLQVPLEQYSDHEEHDPEWDEKPNNSTFIWRGSTTGVWFERGTLWRSSQRMRLYFLTKEEEKSSIQLASLPMSERTKRVRFSEVDPNSGLEVVVEREVDVKKLVERYMDFAFSGQMHQCTNDGTCERVKDIIEYEAAMTWPQQNSYKYQLDIDG